MSIIILAKNPESILAAYDTVEYDPLGGVSYDRKVVIIGDKYTIMGITGNINIKRVIPNFDRGLKLQEKLVLKLWII